ncbi:hypothetical protein IFM89_009601 [Coptis chinensis]|uniref:Uncharacterized protein n=1 Tax=Coptis chinensis TaxID=261450 RepID=A0A835IJ15_9MAGN|nr:hypothetical protein IFM89_009601 [Coptis chinensis]
MHVPSESPVSYIYPNDILQGVPTPCSSAYTVNEDDYRTPKDEHEEILKNRENVDSPLTWNEYKSMTFTSHVVDETLRLGNIAPLIFRRPTRDIQKDDEEAQS